MRTIEELVRKNIRALQPYSSARDEFKGKSGIFLDANENPYGTLNRYPDPYQIMLKKKLGEIKGLTVDSIFVGNGSDEVIDLVYRIFCEPGVDKALTFSPTYGMYQVSAAINNVELIQLPLDTTFQINFEEFAKTIEDKTVKLIFICSPNNPTGNRIINIERVLELFDGIVIVDEAYSDFSKEESSLSLVSKYPNLIVAQTLSKAYGLAAARIGLAFANNEIINYYNKVKPPYNVSKLNQEAAIEILNQQEKIDIQVEAILTERTKLVDALSQFSIVKKIYPSDSNFVLVQVYDANGLYNYLVSKQIIVRNRNSVVKNCIRISIGKPEENEVLINAISEFKS